MLRRSVLRGLAAWLALPMLLAAASVRADDVRISGPVVHDNLAIYFVHGASTGGPVPLTLAEALAGGSVRVYETGNVNQLAIENLGADEVFVQSGDIVKGGQQDRVLMVSLVLPPHSGRIPIASFCVEQGRWSARGTEDVRRFASAGTSVPSREAKLAMQAPAPGAASPVGPTRSDTGLRQQQVWDNVSKIQKKLERNVGAPVASPQSQTSLQLALENEKLAAARAAYIKALQAAGERDGDIVGYVFAVNGKLNSADLYPSNGLFRKMWPKLIAANATEAIGERNEASGAPPSIETVTAFLDTTRLGAPSEKELTGAVRQETRASDSEIFLETRRADEAWVHRRYLAK
jgi:hypothetical protein